MKLFANKYWEWERKRMQESGCLVRGGRSFIAFSFITFQICPPCVYGVFLKTQWSAKSAVAALLSENSNLKLDICAQWRLQNWKLLTPLTILFRLYVEMVCYPGNTFSDSYCSLLKLRAGTIDVLLVLLKKGWQRCDALFGLKDTTEKERI